MIKFTPDEIAMWDKIEVPKNFKKTMKQQRSDDIIDEIRLKKLLEKSSPTHKKTNLTEKQ